MSAPSQVTDEVEFPPTRKVSKEFKDFVLAILKKNPKERLPCKDLLAMEFIRKYQDLESCEELCQ
jgi:serine/threonine protein kinase